MKKIIVVSNKINRKYAENIKMRLTEAGKNGFSYEVSCYSEDEYNQNVTRFSTENFVVFVGKTKTTETVNPFVEWIDRGCGIKYGRLGNKFFVYAENIDDETKFIDYARKKAEKFGIQGINSVKTHDPKTFQLYDTLDLSDPCELVASVVSTIVASPLVLAIKGFKTVDYVLSLPDRGKILKMKFELIIAEFLSDVLLNKNYMEQMKREYLVRTPLVIVAPKKPNAYAELLSAAVYENTADFDVSIMDEEKYLMQKLSSSQKVVFLNGCKYAKKNVVPNIKWKYSRWGICYGWGGNMAVVANRKPDEKMNEDYEKFIKSIREELKINSDKTKLNSLSTDAAATLSVPLTSGMTIGTKHLLKFSVPMALFIVIFDDLVMQIVNDNKKGDVKVREKLLREYYALYKFIDKGLAEFLEE